MATYSSVACAEEHGSQKENYDLDSGPQASVTLRCAWDDRHGLVQDLLMNRRPWPHGGFTKPPVAQSASITPAPDAAYVESGQACEYGLTSALVSVNYNCKVLQLVSESLEPTTEFLKQDYRRFHWANAAEDGPDDKLLEGEAPGRLVRGMNIVRTYYQLAAVPAVILTLPGCVNDAAYVSTLLGLTFPAETLLFNPPKLSRVIKTNGTEGFNMDLKFTYKSQGWNKFWRSKTRQYTRMWITADPTSDPAVVAGIFNNYPLEDFSDLFS